MARKQITKSRRTYLDTRKKADIAAGLCWVCRKPNSNNKQKCDNCNKRHKSETSSQTQSARSKDKWQDPQYRNNILSHQDKVNTISSETTKLQWQDPSFREHVSNTNREITANMWQDPLYREKHAIGRLNCPKVSLIQLALYQILDELGIKHFREYLDKATDPECLMGPWTFDCVIPKDITILIEVQGDYWHSLPESVIRDTRKAEYVKSLGNQYRLEYIWEHEFDDLEAVKSRIKSWLK